MSFRPHWRRDAATGWFPVPADKAYCLYCHEPLRKLHGVNQTNKNEVMGLFLFGTGVWCIHCGVKAWTDPDFFRRSGSNAYSSRHWDLERGFRPRDER